MTILYALPFFKMDSSSECGTKLDFSNESNPPPLVKAVSDPVIGIKKAKCFDSGPSTRIGIRDIFFLSTVLGTLSLVPKRY